MKNETTASKHVIEDREGPISVDEWRRRQAVAEWRARKKGRPVQRPSWRRWFARLMCGRG